MSSDPKSPDPKPNASTPPTQDTIRLPEDHLVRRLRWAVIVSLVVNIAAFCAASGGMTRPAQAVIYPDVEMTRVEVVVPKQKGRKPVYRPLPPPRPRKVAQQPRPRRVTAPPPRVHQSVPPPTPVAPRPRVASVTPPVRQVKVSPHPAAAPPEGAHTRVMVAQANPRAAHRPDDFTALAGGNARAGQAMARQEAGNAAVNPVSGVTAPSPAPVVSPRPEPERVVASPAAPPPPSPRPEPSPVPEPSPSPRPIPKPSGPTRDAEASSQVQPDIPDSLKNGSFKSFVRVRVEVSPDGDTDVTLRTSSGDPEIDSRVLDALKRWRWKPALKNGVAVASTQLFKFEFEVQ